MNFSNRNFFRWFIQGTVGILLTGAGISMVVEAGLYKHTHPPLLIWMGAGTLSLIVLMAGLILMIDSLRYRIRYDEEKHSTPEDLSKK